MSPLRRPPADLASFPRRELHPELPLYRVHRRVHGPWWFSSDGSGRFDLPPPRGTCYLAEEPLGSFVEVFRDESLIAEADIFKRFFSTVGSPDLVSLADCTHGLARSFGVTAAIHSSEDYARTQLWAKAFAGGGFGGVRYFVSHDPAQVLVGVALFGDAGAHDWPVAHTESISEELLLAARERFGIIVLPTP